ncbi:MAG: hypothetical protein O2890_10225 [Cyanobacteria bacterium]|nr:hypothetical protein [Cyanobacteriota bacterium]MDA0866776.1 hypothetical protein [Cyanobacteriota bacterium]
MLRNHGLKRFTGLGLGLGMLLLDMGAGQADSLKGGDASSCAEPVPFVVTDGVMPCKGQPTLPIVAAQAQSLQGNQPQLDTIEIGLVPLSSESSLDVTGHGAGAIALTDDTTRPIDVDPGLIESSPVLQRWLEDIPDVATDIKHDPAFRTRIRLGYAHFPSNDQTGGLYVGVQDVFVGRTPLTLSAEYSQNGRGDRTSYGFDAQYYALPLGSYGNFAPVLGYRYLETPTYISEGVNVGFRVVLIPSRTGAADISLTQTWVAPGSHNEVGLTTLSVGYAVTSQLRISTDIQTQNTATRQDSRVGVLLEWML